MAVITEKVVVGNKEVVFSIGALALQADAAVVVQSGGTLVLVTACYLKKPSVAKEYLPLMVEYQEKTYAAGRIPGGFLKREGRPKDNEILCARLIDRPLRPLLNPDLRHEIQIVAEVFSSDAENDPDVLAVNGAALALMRSGLPMESWLGCVRVIHKDNAFILNPSYEERETATLDLIVAGTESKIMMLEGVAFKETDSAVLEAVKVAHAAIKKIIEVQKKIGKGDTKNAAGVFTFAAVDEQLLKKVEAEYLREVKAIVARTLPKEEFHGALQALKKAILENAAVTGGIPPEVSAEPVIDKIIAVLEEKAVRERIIRDKIRADGRKPDDLRQITCQVSVLPRTHGSALFRRGQTQSLAVTTLGTTADGQIIEGLNGRDKKHFLMHYAFPPFSVGEVKPMRGPSRRDIGHGALAEKALQYVLPTKEEFPYTIRVVSEILESNGSSSMATVCSSSLSLMDAGVPIKESVAGIAMGLIKEGDTSVVLTDIAGLEDLCGDMDFKIAGVQGGITAIQLDVKNDGLDYSLIEEALKKSQDARSIILDKMVEVISGPRSEISKYAPKIKSVKINIEKIGELIGPGGRNIRKLSRDYNVQIDIDDEEGMVSVIAETEDNLRDAVQKIIEMTKDVEAGEIYDAKVVKIMNFGAFCELLPGKQGLLHISEIASGFVKSVSDHLREGDIVTVKVKEIDENGRINLTRKGLLNDKDQPE